MHTKIQIFRNEVFGEIRTLTNEKGETFFVGKDVAKALGYSNTRKALLDHVDKEDKVDGVTIRDAIGRDRKFFVFCADTDFLLGQHGLRIWSTNWGTYPTRSAHITCRI